MNRKQLRVGRQPGWSPDGKTIVFVSPDTSGREKIWVMGANGDNPTQLSVGSQKDLYPVFTPSGRHIVFASNKAINEEGVPNFDIWMMRRDGQDVKQLTVNGSHDTRPALSPDGQSVYFISNRGARRQGQPAMQIWRIELLEEARGPSPYAAAATPTTR